MKTKMILLGTVAAVSIAAAQQSNARGQGWYVGLEAGANWVDDNNAFWDSDPSPNFPVSMEFDTGWAVLATVGYAFDNNWRLEIEGGYRQNDMDVTGATTRLGGDFDELTLMANVLYDIPLTERLAFTVGVGVGVDYAQFDDGTMQEDEDWNFAYQGIAGFSYELTNRLDLTLQYRYLNVDAPGYVAPHAGHVDSYALDDVEKHTVTVGLRYDLYEDEAPVVTQPPVVPPEPVAEPKQFIIYFGFNKCNITPEADKVLGEAADAAKSGGSASVQIVGHTDTVGSDAYNNKLSNCRANAAKSGLVSKGVPAGSITASGRGESELLVKTGDNVKEPQNRRATIDLD